MRSICFSLTLLTGSPLVTLFLVLMGNYAIKRPSFALATETLLAAVAAAGIAATNTLAHLGTGAVTSLIGILKQQTGSFPVSLLPLCALTGIGAVVLLWMGHRQQPAMVSSPAE